MYLCYFPEGHDGYGESVLAVACRYLVGTLCRPVGQVHMLDERDMKQRCAMIFFGHWVFP